MPPPTSVPLATRDLVVCGDNLEVMGRLPPGRFQLAYLDPPFNTGHRQIHHSLSARTDPVGDRYGFAGRRYRTEEISQHSYDDRFEDYPGFLAPRLEAAWRLLANDGTLYLHLDYREVHYAKVLCDELFGRRRFLNEIIWAYDYGARPKRRWPTKHDTILVYVRDPERYFFDRDAVERIPYMAPGLVTAQKAARGKLPTDVWWHTIVPTNSKEKTGYPTQKPEGVLRRIVSASSAPGAFVLDPFCGAGTTGAVARALGRRFVLIDENPAAISVTCRRLGAEATRYLDATDLAGDLDLGSRLGPIPTVT